MTKYKAQRTTINGHTFDSKAEARRYAELWLMNDKGLIQNLELQPSFVLAPSVKYEGSSRAKPALRYVADFSYIENDKLIVEDVKGMETQAFKIKRHLMKHVYKVDVRVTK